MNFDLPKAVFCGLALIAAAIYFGPGASPSNAYTQMVNANQPIPVVICDAGQMQRRDDVDHAKANYYSAENRKCAKSDSVRPPIKT